MIYLTIKKGFIAWIKSPFGLVIFIVGLIIHIASSPLYLYVERDREHLNWTDINEIEFTHTGGRYGSYKLIATAMNGKKYGFSGIGFRGGESVDFAKTLGKGARIGWYSTCFYLKSPVVGDAFFSDKCAVIMEVISKKGTIISFEDRVIKIEQNYFYFLIMEVYLLLAINSFFSLSALVFICIRKAQEN